MVSNEGKKTRAKKYKWRFQDLMALEKLSINQLRNRTWKGQKPSIKQRRGEGRGESNTGGRGGGSSGLAGGEEKKIDGEN